MPKRQEGETGELAKKPAVKNCLQRGVSIGEASRLGKITMMQARAGYYFDRAEKEKKKSEIESRTEDQSQRKTTHVREGRVHFSDNRS